MIDLSTIHTKVLLSWQKEARINGYYYYNPKELIPFYKIKAELNTREHVPNKTESKYIRQLAAKNKRR